MSNTKESKYEEITDMPEDIAEAHEIDGAPSKESEPEPSENLEEVSGDIDESALSNPIIDDYNEQNSTVSDDNSAIKEEPESGIIESDSAESDSTEPDIPESDSVESDSTESDIVESDSDEIEKDPKMKISISKKIKEKLPDDFNISDIGNIDLIEAEAVANEDILFMTESDLMEGLEDLDLIPLKDDDSKIESEIEAAPEKEIIERAIEVVIEEEEEVKAEAVKEDERVDKKEEIEEKISDKEEEPEEQAEDREKEIVDETDKAPEEIEAFEKPGEPAEVDTEEQKDLVPEEKFERRRKFEGYVYADDNEFGIVDSETRVEEEGLAEEDELDEDDSDDFICILEREDEVEETVEEEEKEIEVAEVVESAVTDKTLVEKKIDDGHEVEELDDGLVVHVEKETLPEDLYTIEKTDSNVTFIDDGIVEKPSDGFHEIYMENELDKVSTDVVPDTEGKVKVLFEDGAAEKGKQIPAPSEIAYPVKIEDMLIDFEEDEYKYRDDELDFIHSSITEENYSRYISEIDEYYELDASRRSTNVIELFGLNQLELDTIESSLFESEYKEVNLDEMYELFVSDFDASAFKDKNFSYLLPVDESLFDSEKISIEEDISSAGALIYEENIEEIKSLLGKTGKEEKIETVEVEEVHDITDNIVIMEDDIDIDRFIKEFPENKHADLENLFQYFDGLFEKLPENALKNFVNSEYFDLYVKVLRDMGI